MTYAKRGGPSRAWYDTRFALTLSGNCAGGGWNAIRSWNSQINPTNTTSTTSNKPVIVRTIAVTDGPGFESGLRDGLPCQGITVNLRQCEYRSTQYDWTTASSSRCPSV